MSDHHKTPTLIDAIIPIIVLIIMLSVSVYLYGDNSSYGANQIALILSASIGAIIAIKIGSTNFSGKLIAGGILLLFFTLVLLEGFGLNEILIQ